MLVRFSSFVRRLLHSGEDFVPTRVDEGAPENLRLAMGILVRDEVDLIGENIRFHALQGVDCFIVMDNGSVDGTRELLVALRSEVDIEILDNPRHTIDQDLWMTQIAQHVSDRGLASWFIPNDADEFWVSRTGNLKAELSQGAAIIDVPRQNMLPRRLDVERDDYHFYHNIMAVLGTLGFAKPCIDPDQQLDVDLNLRRIPGKVMFRLAGFENIGMGNHRVIHKEDKSAGTDCTLIYHYPVRSYEQFVKKVCNYGTALKASSRLAPDVSWHLQRLYKQFERGRLAEEYSRFVLSDDRAEELVHLGVLASDECLASFFT